MYDMIQDLILFFFPDDESLVPVLLLNVFIFPTELKYHFCWILNPLISYLQQLGVHLAFAG